MKPINIKARIKRNKLDIVAGKNYRNEESEIVKYLRKTNKDAILGIENENGLYTILGEEKVYYRNKNGVEGDISLLCCAKSPGFEPLNNSNFINLLQSQETSESKGIHLKRFIATKVKFFSKKNHHSSYALIIRQKTNYHPLSHFILIGQCLRFFQSVSVHFSVCFLTFLIVIFQA
ncbi:hypothetical protein [Chryseobacterium indologenes]|uniref:hypothetical protein n=1 Tax=Chryseobacterium indologenes TaxID=253 RepID=UPI00162A778D|nr:hypothetical protein [Chryseobacterium indologenes]